MLSAFYYFSLITSSYFFLCFFFFYLYGAHRDLHVLTHSFPTRRSSDLNLRETLPTIVAALKRHPRAWYRNNKLNENLVAWNDNSVSKLAELDPHKPEAAAGEMAGMVHGAMDHGNVDHAAMGHEAGATDMAMPGDAAHGDHMALMDRDERRARWALYANIGLGL